MESSAHGLELKEIPVVAMRSIDDEDADADNVDDEDDDSVRSPALTSSGTTLGGSTIGAPSSPSAQNTAKKNKNKRKKPPAAAASSPQPSSNALVKAPVSPSAQAAKKRSFVVKTHRDNEYSSEEEEDEEDYKRGGYHPVAIGDVFNRRYAVEAKLGWGHFSTVWLARDTVSSSGVLALTGSGAHGSPVQVALKIVKSAQHYTEAARDEIHILERLSGDAGNHAGSACVIRLLDHFDVRGPHGVHVAMAFEKLGCNLLTLIRMYRYKGLPVPLVRHFARQLLLGVSYLHACRIIHTDLKPENLLLAHTPTLVSHHKRAQAKRPREPEHKQDEKDKETQRRDAKDDDGEHQEEEEERRQGGSADASSGDERDAEGTGEGEGAPHLPWTPSELSAVFGEAGAFRLKIVDLGNACWFDRHFTDDVQTRQYRAPEVILGQHFDERIDVWSIACIVFELLTGDLLFEPKSGRSYDKNDDHLAQMQELLGRMPRQVATLGRHSRDYFNRRGELRYIKTLKFWPLADVLRDKYRYSSADADAVAAFLLPMLHFEPQRRASAHDMLSAPWVKDIDVTRLESAWQ